jgi:CMP-N-acetylneuraminic acid synthetase
VINNKKVLVVVTARAGSKGIPLKNIRPLLGKPLFLWSVEAGLQSKYVDMTVVSSNCDEVWKCFHEYSNNLDKEDPKNNPAYLNKMKFIQRPDELATDTSKNEEALMHAVHWSRDILEQECDIVVNLQPTSPCRLSGLLDKCLEKYSREGYNSLLTATKDTPFLWRKVEGKWEYGCTQWEWQRTDNVDNFPSGWTFLPEEEDPCNRKMRQEFLEDEDNSEFVWHDNGNIYITDKKVLMETGCRIGDNPGVMGIGRLNGLQIDEEFDFELIENMAKTYDLRSLI